MGRDAYPISHVSTRGIPHPRAVRVGGLPIQDDEFGQLVRVQRAQPRLDGGPPLARRLDDDLPLGVALDRTLPSVGRRHRSVNVDARGEPFVDQRPRQRVSPIVVRHGRQDKDEV